MNQFRCFTNITCEVTIEFSLFRNNKNDTSKSIKKNQNNDCSNTYIAFEVTKYYSMDLGYFFIDEAYLFIKENLQLININFLQDKFIFIISYILTKVII